ncbi:MAG: efflux RND transporter periplasmic adaptor subunit [Nitrosomonas sp.]|nr:efflux RND transporter periplasmic adaptor subunit [Nitrosomonas sp.]
MSKSLVITAVVMLLVGISGGWFAKKYLQSDTTQHQQSNGQTANSVKIKKPLFYRNPMNLSVTSPVPAKDSMGMDYVPVYADDDTETDSVPGTVKIDPVTEQNIGVRTITVKKDTLSHVVRAVGRVDYDEERIVRLHPKVEGWIETMRVDKTGEKVKKGRELLSIYSPQLVVSQQEYILALNNLKGLEQSPIEDIRRGAEELVNSSRERLKLLDVPAHQLHDLTQNHNIHKSLHIHSPASGIVVNIGAREGQYVTPTTEIYMIADLSRIWVYVDIYENELPWVKRGDLAEMQLAGIPGRTFRGHLAFIYPYAEAKTRTIKVRLEFDNTELLLKPDMFAEVSIYAGKQMSALVIPSEAVIRSGTRDKVLVVRSAGKFEPRTITAGIASEGKVIVLEGLKEGEEIVTSSQFLIDSESSLREATAKMLNPGLQEAAPNPLQREEEPHQHD